MRLYAFDNLRLVSIFLVILFHSMCAYTVHVEWWYVHIDDQVSRYAAFMGLTDMFVMATIFFVSGFFAAKSHRRTHNSGYLKQRLSRLLIPGYLQLLLVCPLLFYVSGSVFSMESLQQTFVSTWQALSHFEFAPIQPGTMSFHHHIWFVEVLFIVGAVLMLTRRWTNSFLLAADETYKVITCKLIFLMTLGWLITYIPLAMGFGIHDWQNMGGLVVAQPVRLGSYIAAYLIGLYFFGLFEHLSLKKLGLACLFAVIGFTAVCQLMLLGVKASLAPETLHDIAVAYTRILVCFVLLFTTTFAFLKFINRKYRWIAPLYPLNYGIYLMHMIFVVALQALLADLDWDTDTKVLVICFLALFLSIASTYLKQNIHWGRYQPISS